jgi:competence protein ComEA
MQPPPPFLLPPDDWRARLRGLLAGAGRQGRALAAVVLAALALAAVIWVRATPRTEPAELPGDPAGLPRLTAGPTAGTGPDAAPRPAAAPGRLLVHVAGRVLRPGLVELAAGSRVADAVAAAGGASRGADLDRLNLARRLTDGEQILVAARGQPSAAAAPQSAGQPTPAGPIDLNTATPEQLETLPGVGEVTAGRIVAYRTAHPFSSVAELRQVDGIGERRFELLKDLVTVG